MNVLSNLWVLSSWRFHAHIESHLRGAGCPACSPSGCGELWRSTAWGWTCSCCGAAVGLVRVIGGGVADFQGQAKLPMKKLLSWTGVLAVMVGNTVHTLQRVGWLPVHPLPFSLPAALGLWLGLRATWERVLLQVGSVGAVIGPFFAAEALKPRELRQRQRGVTVQT